MVGVLAIALFLKGYPIDEPGDDEPPESAL
jgi:hypothetical protein